MLTPVPARLWQDLIAALRSHATRPGQTVELFGSIAANTASGEVLVDGVVDEEAGDWDGPALTALFALTEVDPRRTMAVRVRVSDAGADVTTVRSGDGIELQQLRHPETVVVELVPASLPAPYRHQPGPADYARPASPTADAGFVAAYAAAEIHDPGAPVSAQALAAVEARLGVALPEEVRALFAVAGSGSLPVRQLDEARRLAAAGEEPDDGPETFWESLLPPDQDGSYPTAAARSSSWQFGALEVLPADPQRRLFASAHSEAWFPIAGEGGEYMVVDLAPGPGGNVGQLLWVPRFPNAGAVWVAPSLAHALRHGYADLSVPDPAPGALLNIDGTRGWGAAQVAPHVEVVRINAAAVDLTPLRDKPRLRTVVLAEMGDARAAADVFATLPALEYLEAPADAIRRLGALGRLPGTLQAVGLKIEPDASWEDTIALIDALRGLRGLPGAAVETFRMP